MIHFFYSRLILDYENNSLQSDVFFIRTKILKQIASLFRKPQMGGIDARLRDLTDGSDSSMLSLWIFNFIRFGNLYQGEEALVDIYHDYQMVSLESRYLKAMMAKATTGFVDFDQFNYEKQYLAKNPFDGYSDFIKNEIPLIYKENSKKETKLEFAYIPKNSCKTKKKIISLIKTSFLGFNERRNIRNMFS